METAVITKEATLMILFDGPSEHVGTSVRYRVSVWPPDFETKARSLGLDTLLKLSMCVLALFPTWYLQYCTSVVVSAI